MLINKKTLDAIKELNYKQVYEKGISEEKARWKKKIETWKYSNVTDVFIDDKNQVAVSPNEFIKELLGDAE